MELDTTLGNAISTVRRIVPLPRFIDHHLATLQFRLFGLRFEGTGRGIGSLRRIEDDEIVAAWSGHLDVIDPHPDTVFVRHYSPNYDAPLCQVCGEARITQGTCTDPECPSKEVK